MDDNEWLTSSSQARVTTKVCSRDCVRAAADGCCEVIFPVGGRGGVSKSSSRL